MQMLFHSENPQDNTIIPNEEEQRHIRALRIENGDRILVSNGRGTLYLCEAIVLKKETHFTILESTFHEPREAYLEIAIAPTKNNDRLEWFVEKAVELGIEKIYLIKCDHSERPIIKTERLYRVAIAALKQSRKAYLPEITELISFKEVIDISKAQIKCIAHCNDNLPKQLLKNTLRKGQSALICIGPEGDFSEKEVQLASQNDYLGVSLGESRLRTETAGIAAVHTFELIQQ
jgi:16S rRNA (uracil1498-N3)-methyltransferase